VTLDDMAGFGGHGFVYVLMHGTYARYSIVGGGVLDGLLGRRPTAATSFIVTGERRSRATDAGHAVDLRMGRVGYSNGCYMVAPGFINANYRPRGLAGGILFIGSCELMGRGGEAYEGWTGALAGHAAADAFVGFRNTNMGEYDVALARTFLEGLLRGDTARAALDAGLGEHGRDDAAYRYGGYLDDPPGYPLLRGDPDATLGSRGATDPDNAGEGGTGLSLYPAYSNGDGRWGFIDTSGGWVIAPQFTMVRPFDDGFATALDAESGLYGVIDRQGRWTAEPQFVYAAAFSQGLAAARGVDGNLLGYIDPQGNWVIQPQFSSGEPFADGHAAVALLGVDHPPMSWAVVNDAVIDATGKVVLQLTNPDQSVMGLSEGVAAVWDYREQRLTFMGLDGREIYSYAKTAAVVPFSDGMAGAMDVSGLWGFIDRQGRWAIEPRYRSVGAICDGLAFAQDDQTGMYGYIDTQGRWAIDPVYANAASFHDGLALAEGGGAAGWGVTDANGEWLVQPSLDILHPSDVGEYQIGNGSDRYHVLHYADATSSNLGSYYGGLALVAGVTDYGRLAEYRYIDHSGKTVCSWYPSYLE
jgi:hypothetical protein